MTKIQAHNTTHNEGGEGYNPHEDAAYGRAKAASEAHIQSLIARAAEIRAAWNAETRARSVNGRLTMADLKAIEKAVGVTQNDMHTLKARGAFA